MSILRLLTIPRPSPMKRHTPRPWLLAAKSTPNSQHPGRFRLVQYCVTAFCCNTRWSAMAPVSFTGHSTSGWRKLKMAIPTLRSRFCPLSYRTMRKRFERCNRRWQKAVAWLTRISCAASISTGKMICTSSSWNGWRASHWQPFWMNPAARRSIPKRRWILSSRLAWHLNTPMSEVLSTATLIQATSGLRRTAK